jgi:Flp pilus assembly pilin Flp
MCPIEYPLEIFVIRQLHKFWSDRSGQALPEYGLLVAAVVVLVIIASAAFSGPVINLFMAMGDYIKGS